MAGNFFRGTNVDQDGRWGKSDQKLIEKMTKTGKFAAILDRKVDLSKVNLEVIRKWVGEKIMHLLGFEDDIVINLVMNNLESKSVDPKALQLHVTGFLEKNSKQFMEELWNLITDAAEQPTGIPSVFLQKKKVEIEARNRFSSKDTSVINSDSDQKNLPGDRYQDKQNTLVADSIENSLKAEAKLSDRGTGSSTKERGNRKDAGAEYRRRDDRHERRVHRERSRSRSRSRSSEDDRKRYRDRKPSHRNVGTGDSHSRSKAAEERVPSRSGR